MNNITNEQINELAKQKEREYIKRWSQENKEHLREYQKQYREQNREKFREYKNNYWRKQAVKELVDNK